MTADDFTIFIVDDDASVRDALSLLLGVYNYRTTIFATAESFLSAYRREWKGCLLIDIRMPDMDGLTLQRHLRDSGCKLPAIIMTGHGDIATARTAFRQQAIDFLEKPLDKERLLSAIREAREYFLSTHQAAERYHAFNAMLSRLTSREREVMEMVVVGRHNREIASDLNISPRTVEVHKSRVMQKLGVDSVAQLVRLSLEGTPPPEQPAA